MLHAEGLVKRYGSVVAVDRLDLQLSQGAILGMVGNNGAGKTTTIKMLAGLLEPSEGQVRVDGDDPLHAPVRARIGYLPEDSPLYEDMTPVAYLLYFGAIYGMSRSLARSRAETLLRRLRLDEVHWKKPIQELSKGSARKVALARTLLHDPLLVILDEPRSGLDPATQTVLDAFLLELKREGKAILLSAHDLDQVERICDTVVVVHDGRIIKRGTVDDLRREAGTTQYTVRATVPFPGSQHDGPEHVGHVGPWDHVAPVVEHIRRTGGEVLDVAAEPPRLSDVLGALA